MASLYESAPLRSYDLALQWLVGFCRSTTFSQGGWSYAQLSIIGTTSIFAITSYTISFSTILSESYKVSIRLSKKKLLALISKAILPSLHCSGQAYSYPFAHQSEQEHQHLTHCTPAPAGYSDLLGTSGKPAASA